MTPAPPPVPAVSSPRYRHTAKPASRDAIRPCRHPPAMRSRPSPPQVWPVRKYRSSPLLLFRALLGFAQRLGPGLGSAGLDFDFGFDGLGLDLGIAHFPVGLCLGFRFRIYWRFHGRFHRRLPLGRGGIGGRPLLLPLPAPQSFPWDSQRLST